MNSPWPSPPGWQQSASLLETGETNIIFAPGLSSNKYFGCWAQTKWPWPPAAQPSQGVFSLNGQKQQQTCFLFLRILNKKWGRDALWKLLEKRNSDVIPSFWIITVQCLCVVMLCQCFVCALRGGGACLLLLSPIIPCLTCRDPDHQGKNWGLTISLHYAECDQGLAIAWRAHRRQDPVSGNNPPPGPADNRGEIMLTMLKSCLGTSREQYFPLVVTVWQHYNIVTVSQNGRQRLLMALLPALLTW